MAADRVKSLSPESSHSDRDTDDKQDNEKNDDTGGEKCREKTTKEAEQKSMMEKGRGKPD